MPQMAPMIWTMLYITFILSLMMTMAIIFFNLSMNEKNKNIMIKENNIKWKW
nr:ATP synthase F0 subunit 8 [Ceratocombus sp. HL-2012]